MVFVASTALASLSPPRSVANPTFFAGAHGVLGSIQFANTNAGEIVSDETQFFYDTTDVSGALRVNNITSPGGVRVPKLGSGVSNQSDHDSIAIGVSAGTTQGGTKNVALGFTAGASQGGLAAIAVGANAGASQVGAGAVAIGDNAGFNQSGAGAIAIGKKAAYMNAKTANTQGDYSIVIGHNACASEFSVPANAIVLDAKNGDNIAKTSAITTGFFVDPVADLSGASGFVTTVYNPTSKEFRYVARDTELIAAYYDSVNTPYTLTQVVAGPYSLLSISITRLVECGFSALGVVTFTSIAGVSTDDEIFAQVYLNSAAVGIPMRVAVPNIAYLGQTGQITVSFSGVLAVQTNTISLQLYCTRGAGILVENGSLAIQSGMMKPGDARMNA